MITEIKKTKKFAVHLGWSYVTQPKRRNPLMMVLCQKIG